MSDAKIVIQYHILSVDATVHLSHLENLVTLNERMGDDSPFMFSIGHTSHHKPACLAHNIMADQFLTNPSKPDWLWIWAHDMEVSDQTYKLLDHLGDADILCPSVRIWLGREDIPVLTAAFKEPGSGPYTFRFGNFPESLQPYEVDACGTGGLLIHRRVFDDPRMLLHAAEGDDPPTYFQDIRTPTGRRLFGHDLDFTWRAKKLGYKVLFVPAAEAEHTKSLGLNRVTGYSLNVSSKLQERLTAIESVEATRLQLAGYLGETRWDPDGFKLWMECHFAISLPEWEAHPEPPTELAELAKLIVATRRNA